jgi:hypothetical protein
MQRPILSFEGNTVRIDDQRWDIERAVCFIDNYLGSLAPPLMGCSAMLMGQNCSKTRLTKVAPVPPNRGFIGSRGHAAAR